MQFFEEEKSNLKLLDNIFCTKCKSKKLEVLEIMSSANAYTTNENGEVCDVELDLYSTISPLGMQFNCLNCGHHFKKRGVTLLYNALTEIE